MRTQLQSVLAAEYWAARRASCHFRLPLLDARTLTRPNLFLDKAKLDELFSKIGGGVGAIPAHVGSRFTQTVARRMAVRLGRQFASGLDVPAQALAEAWFFPLWCELCTLIPIRHLARHIARLAGSDPVLVPLSETGGTYLSYWDQSSLEPFLLVSEIRRAGTPALLVIDGNAGLTSWAGGGSFTYRLNPHPLWTIPPLSRPAKVNGKKAVVQAGMRGQQHVLARVGDPFLVQSGFAGSSQEFHETLLKHAAPLPAIELTFLRDAQSGLRFAPLQHFSCRLPRTSLRDWLHFAIGPRTKTAAEEARRLVAEYATEEAHVCDHMFFESALVAHAVRASGGRVVLWPHSSNALHVDVRGSQRPDHVYCITKASSDIWGRRYKGITRTVLSELMLKPCAAPRPLTGTLITVVVIAGSHGLNRMPVLDIKGHSESYRRLFSGLSAIGPGVRFVCKAKAPWESMKWLRSLAPGIAIEERLESPGAIDLPNMIFVTVSFGSTAIFEGLGRGIPSMVVRDIAVEDYAAIDAESVPIGPVDMILDEIRKCRDPAHFMEITRRQLAWYNSQTSFSAVNP